MNRLYFILISLNIFALGMWAGVTLTHDQMGKSCQQHTSYHIGDQEYACIKLPGVITEEEANALPN